MNLANPTALLWAGLAVPVVAFYVLKVRLRRVPVSTNLFWRQIFREKQARSLWHYLRHLVSLLVQLAFLALLVLALAEPFSEREVQAARRWVLVVDNSASMNATDENPTRLAAAREKGRRLVDQLRWDDQMAVVAAGTQPRVLCGLTGHRATLRGTLDEVGPTDGPTRVSEAVALARRLLADQPNGQVIVLTDGCFAGARELGRAGDVRLLAVGGRTGNVGITRFQARRSFSSPLGYEVLVEVVNHSDEPVECRLDLTLNDDVIDVVPLRLEADGRWSQVLEKSSAEGGRLVARLDRPDALLLDNQAQALLPCRRPQPVALVTEGNWFLEKALEASSLVQLSVSAEPPPAVPPDTITVFHRKVPARLPPGPVLVIDPAGPCDLWQLGDKLANPVVVRQAKDSPLMAHVPLDRALMPEARQLTPRGEAEVLAAAETGDPLYCAFRRPEGKVLVLTVNLDRGDLRFRTAFPILIVNALTWLADSRDELQEAQPAGAVLDVNLPARGSGETAQPELSLWAPDGQARKLPASGFRATVGPLDQCGFWSIAARRPGGGDDDPSAVTIACNLASDRESDLRPPEGLQTATESLGTGYAGRPVWFYLLLAALALAALEWYLYQRRWIS